MFKEMPGTPGVDITISRVFHQCDTDRLFHKFLSWFFGKWTLSETFL